MPFLIILLIIVLVIAFKSIKVVKQAEVYIIERLGKFNVEEAERLNIPKKYWKSLQNGEEVDGYTPNQVMGEKRKGFKFCYCTDTRPTEKLPKFVKNADLFICEGMYGESERTCGYTRRDGRRKSG